MTTNPPGVRDAGRRSRLEARANAVRAQLMQGLDALREKKRTLLDPGEEMRRHMTATVVLAGGLALVFGGSAGVIGYRASTRKERLLRRRLDAWKRLIARPERAAPPRRGLARAALEQSLLAGLSAVVAALGKHYALELIAHLSRSQDSDTPPPYGQ